MAGAAAQHGPKAYRPVKDAAWAAAHPKRTDEAEAWAQTHPKLAEVPPPLHASPGPYYTALIHINNNNNYRHADPYPYPLPLTPHQVASRKQDEAEAWLHAHPKRSLSDRC